MTPELESVHVLRRLEMRRWAERTVAVGKSGRAEGVVTGQIGNVEGVCYNAISVANPLSRSPAMKPCRRSFLTRSAEVAAVAGLGDLAGLNRLPAVAAQDAQMPRNWAAVASDVEPLVRMLEETPRNRVIEVAAERVRGGTSYQELLAAVMLAGVRGIRPRPVGFKFHAVLVINATHLASLASADRDRWLPLFWAFDSFKRSQETNRTEGDWHMPALEANRIPDAAQAGRRFREAMDHWDEAGADVAIAAWSRSATLNEIYEALWRYGARDFRDIGHKAIYAANSYRTINAIGSRHAEPILRRLLAFA